jgi:hypothetical protein
MWAPVCRPDKRPENNASGRKFADLASVPP